MSLFPRWRHILPVWKSINDLWLWKSLKRSMITAFRHSSQTLSTLKRDKSLDFLELMEQERPHLSLFWLDFMDQLRVWHGSTESKSAQKRPTHALEFAHSSIFSGPVWASKSTCTFMPCWKEWNTNSLITKLTISWGMSIFWRKEKWEAMSFPGEWSEDFHSRLHWLEGQKWLY